jgi:hypothetical protein
MSDKEVETITGLPKKWGNLIKKNPEFKDTADAASVDELKKIIITCEGNLFVIQKETEADTKLASAKEVAKDLASVYREARNMQQAKIQYALLLLESKGVDLDNKDDES